MNITRNKDASSMERRAIQRKSRFLRAIGASGLSQAAWARVNGITPAHLSLVLNGHRESDALTAKIDEFVREHLSRHTALAS